MSGVVLLLSDWNCDLDAPCLTREEESIVIEKLGVYRDAVFRCGLDLPGVSLQVVKMLRSQSNGGLSDYLSCPDLPGFREHLKSMGPGNCPGGWSDVWDGVVPTYMLRNVVIDVSLEVVDDLSGQSDLCEHEQYMQKRKTAPFLGAYKKYKNICDLLVCRNTALVKNLCSKQRMSGSLDYSDLYQEGCKGLLKAVDRFDVESGNRFFTYAYYWIKACMDAAVKNKGRLVRVPFHRAVEANKVNAAKSKLEQRLGRVANDGEISDASGVVEARIADIRFLRSEMVSVDDELGPVIESGAEAPDSYANDAVIRERVLSFLERELSEKKIKVLVRRFGLSGEPPRSFREIGRELDSTEFAVRAAYYDSLKKLRKSPDLAALFGEAFGFADKAVCI